jgi:alpha-mannosidase
MPKSNSYPRLTEAVNHPLLKGITETRLSLFTNGHFASQNLSSILERQRIDSDEFVQLSVWSAPGESKPSFQEAVKQLGQSGDLKPYRKGDRLGLSWTNHWVRALITIPDTYRMSSEPVICECGVFLAE